NVMPERAVETLPTGPSIVTVWPTCDLASAGAMTCDCAKAGTATAARPRAEPTTKPRGRTGAFIFLPLRKNVGTKQEHIPWVESSRDRHGMRVPRLFSRSQTQSIARKDF